MSKMKWILCLTLFALLMPSFSFSEAEKKDYTVQKGDTLWDISGKELKDSFLWPKIWKENPEVANPDRLYPGQIIIIPLYVIQKEVNEPEEALTPAQVIVKPEAKQIIDVEQSKPAVEVRPVVNKDLLIASGYISPSVHSVGVVDGSPSGRNLFGSNDVVYLKTGSPVKIGDKFYIIRAEKKVVHPVSKKNIGYVIEVLGIAEVINLKYGETEAKIAQSFNDIVSGDLLDTYYELTPALIEKPFRTPDINGVVLTSESVRIMNTNFDIIFIDKGKQDGIEIGDMFQIVDVSGPHVVPNGVLQVINESEFTSTAVVKKANDPVSAGNLFSQLE